MKLSDIEFDEASLVIQSLKELLKGFQDDLDKIKETKKALGYISWDDPEEDGKAIKKEIKSLKRVLKLYGS